MRSIQGAITSAAAANDMEPNDIPAQAQEIPLDSARTGRLGYFKSDLTSDTYDWYKVVVPSARTLKFVSKTYDGDLDLQLYIYKTVNDMNNGNPSGDYVGGGGTATDDTVSADVAAGTYYLQVIRRGGIGSYALACGSALLTDAHNPLLAAVKSVPLGVFPNPAGNRMSIRYTVPRTGAVTLSILNTRGETVGTPAAGQTAAGVHECPFDASRLPAGQYVLHLQAGKKIENSPFRVVR